MNELVTKQLVFDCFAGNVTAFQRKLIDEWSHNPQHKELFYQWLEEWELSHLQYAADQQTGLNRYHDFLFNGHSVDSQTSSEGIDYQQPDWELHRNWRFWVGVAAVVMLVLGFVFQQQLLNRTYSTPYEQTQVIALADGSQVVLNANSSLRVPRFGFGDQTRQVWLTGEAQFSVTHTKTHQRFVVTTDNHADVVVLGTEFTLFARPRGTKVVLHRGKVEVHYQQPGQSRQKVTMKPGDRVDLNRNGVARVSQTNQRVNSPDWREHRYTFDQTSLREVTYLFQENFGITLEISDPETASLTLSGTYPAQNSTELLHIIAEALTIQIIRQGDTVLLAPKPS